MPYFLLHGAGMDVMHNAMHNELNTGAKTGQSSAEADAERRHKGATPAPHGFPGEGRRGSLDRDMRGERRDGRPGDRKRLPT